MPYIWNLSPLPHLRALPPVPPVPAEWREALLRGPVVRAERSGSGAGRHPELVSLGGSLIAQGYGPTRLLRGLLERNDTFPEPKPRGEVARLTGDLWKRYRSQRIDRTLGR